MFLWFYVAMSFVKYIFQFLDSLTWRVREALNNIKNSDFSLKIEKHEKSEHFGEFTPNRKIQLLWKLEKLQIKVVVPTHIWHLLIITISEITPNNTILTDRRNIRN